jgi:hypothetical protein
MRPWYWLTPYGFATSLGDAIRAAARRRRRSNTSVGADTEYPRDRPQQRGLRLCAVDPARGNLVGGGVHEGEEGNRAPLDG